MANYIETDFDKALVKTLNKSTTKPKSKKGPKTQFGIYDVKKNALLMTSLSNTRNQIADKVCDGTLKALAGNYLSSDDLLDGFITGEYKIVEINFTINIVKEF